MVSPTESLHVLPIARIVLECASPVALSARTKLGGAAQNEREAEDEFGFHGSCNQYRVNEELQLKNVQHPDKRYS
jgi:hypothetical protein